VRLGVVLTGAGVQSAAGAGVMAALSGRQIEPYAVCGLGAGAWPAALVAAGCGAQAMQEAVSQAQRMGARMLGRGRRAAALCSGRETALFGGMGLQRLLNAQTGGRMLALCPRRAIFPVITARGGHTLVFSTQAFTAADGAMVTLQATVSFAARACMGVAPILSPLEWMGSPLTSMMDTHAAARQLFALGAQRVLIVTQTISPRTGMDALDLMVCGMQPHGAAQTPGIAQLNVSLPDGVSALRFSSAMACMEAGKKTAERELDHLLSCMGMATCRILPFQRG